MTGLVLASASPGPQLAHSLEYLVHALTDEVEIVVVAPDHDRDALHLLRRVADAAPNVRVVASRTGHSLLTRWLDGAAASDAEEIWFVDGQLSPEPELLPRLRLGLTEADATFGLGHCLLPRAVLNEVSEQWRARDPLVDGCLEQLWDALKERALEPLAVAELGLQPSLGIDATLISPEPSRITIGRHTFARASTIIRAFHYTEIEIGAFCSISWDVLIANHGNSGTRLRDDDGRPVPARLTRFSGGHHPDTATTFPLSEAVRPWGRVTPISLEKSTLSRPLVLGNDVWVGVGAKILGGITVGHGAVIGAGAIVVSDVPAYAVVMGNPATVVRYRFSPGVIEQLLRIRWWDWPDEVLAVRHAWFQKPITDFVARFGPEAEDAAAPDLVPPARTSGEHTPA